MSDPVRGLIDLLIKTHPRTDVHLLQDGDTHYAAIATKTNLPCRPLILEKARHLADLLYAPVASAGSSKEAYKLLSEKIERLPEIVNPGKYADYIHELWAGQYILQGNGLGSNRHPKPEPITDNPLKVLDDLKGWFESTLSLQIFPTRYSGFVAMLTPGAVDFKGNPLSIANEPNWDFMLSKLEYFPIGLGDDACIALQELLGKLTDLIPKINKDQETYVRWVVQLNEILTELNRHDQYSMDSFEQFLSKLPNPL